MKKLSIVSIALVAMQAAFGQTYSATVTNQELVRAQGNAGNGSSVFVAESKASAGFAEYTVGEWTAASLGIGGPISDITAANLTFTDGGNSWHNAGSFSIFALTNNSLDLTTLAYNASSAGPEGFGSDISSFITNVGTVSYTANAGGTATSYNVTLDATTKAFAINQLNTNGKLRFVIAANDNQVATSWRGLGNTNPGAPSLSVTVAAVPEPSTALLLVPAFAGILLRKRK